MIQNYVMVKNSNSEVPNSNSNTSIISDSHSSNMNSYHSSIPSTVALFGGTGSVYRDFWPVYIREMDIWSGVTDVHSKTDNKI